MEFFSHKNGELCAHLKGKSLNFAKLTLLLSLVHFWCTLWTNINEDHTFLGTPCKRGKETPVSLTWPSRLPLGLATRLSSTQGRWSRVSRQEERSHWRLSPNLAPDLRE